MREEKGKGGLVGALAVERRMPRKSPQDGHELGLSWVRANLQDGRISARVEAAVSREVDGS